MAAGPASRRKDVMRAVLDWSLTVRAAHHAEHGAELTYEALHDRLTSAVARRDVVLPAWMRVPSFSALYRRVNAAIDSGEEARFGARAGRERDGAGCAPPGGAPPGAAAAGAESDAPAAADPHGPAPHPEEAGERFPLVIPGAPGHLDAGALLVDPDEPFPPARGDRDAQDPERTADRRASQSVQRPTTPNAGSAARRATTRAGPLELLQEAQARLEELDRELAAVDPEHGPDHRRQHAQVIRALKKAREAKRVARLWHALDGARALVRLRETRLTELRALRSRSTVSPAQIPPAPVGDASPRTALVHVPDAAARAPSSTDPDVDPGVFRTRSALVTAEGLAREWGELMAESPQPPVDATVDHVTPVKTLEDARIRVRLLAPVRNGTCDYETCAATWREVFAGTAGRATALILPEIPEFYRNKYRDLSGRSLRRWHDELELEERTADLRGEPARPLEQVLAHAYKPDHAIARTWTPEVEAAVRETWHANRGDWSAAHVARELNERHGWDISERTAQKIVRVAISDRDRAEAQGGADALDTLFRLRILREVVAPMTCWIMDHSFLKQEVAHPGHPEYRRQCRDFDWECHAADDRCYPGGRVVRRRITGLHLTLIMDAYTRRVLGIRVWDRVPTTEMTLLVLREAILRFGLPQVLYTDNGGDFRSHALATLLERLGIRRIFSLPYSPQGRGRLEVMFRKIKQMVMPGIRGYVGGSHPVQWHDADLDTREQVEAVIWRGIERLHNHAVIRRRQMSPVEAWNAHPTARALVNPATDPNLQIALLGLLQRKTDCVRQPFGLEVNGRTYLGLGLRQVPVGGRVWAYVDPYDDDVIHLATPVAGGKVRSLGSAEYYNDEHPVGDAATVLRLEDEWVAVRAAELRRRQDVTDSRARVTGRRAAGEIIATEVVGEIAAEMATLQAPSAPLLLPAPVRDASPTDRPETAEAAERRSITAEDPAMPESPAAPAAGSAPRAPARVGSSTRAPAQPAISIRLWEA
jgi:transposase InsO family protein